MQVKCKSCKSEIPAEDVNLARGLAKCRSCHAIFSFSDQVTGSDQPRARERDQERINVTPPKSITIQDEGHRLLITRRWFTPVAFFLVFFCIAWNSFLIFWYSMVLSGDGPPGFMKVIFIIFPIGHLAVGVGLTYFTIALFVNRTTIEVGQGKLTVRHGPLFWIGNRDLRANGLDQLYCKELVRYGRHGHRRETYQLMAATRTQGHVKLLSGLENADQAISIEQAIERHLEIKDERVAGEMDRS